MLGAGIMGGTGEMLKPTLVLHAPASAAFPVHTDILSFHVPQGRIALKFVVIDAGRDQTRGMPHPECLGGYAR